MVYDLAEDLWVTIFLSQSVSSLMRLRCVCKSWNEIITSSSFTKAHLAHHKTSPKYILINYNTNYKFGPTHMESHNSITNSHLYDVGDIFGREATFHSLEIYGICNGLLCLSENSWHWLHSSHRIYLWNPILRKAKKLPQLGPEFQFELPGLCFGHHHDDYKVIAMTSYLQMYYVCIYSLSTDSWNLLKFHGGATSVTYKFHVPPCPNAKFVKGIAYFIQYSTTSSYRLVSFDLNAEMVQFIKLPKEFDDHSKYIMEEYEESIALLTGDEDVDVVMMWVLRLSDNSFSWVNKCTFQGQGKRLIGFVNNDILLTKNYLAPTYHLYNIENGFQQRFGTLEGRGQAALVFIQDVHYFQESLVLHTETSVNSTSTRNFQYELPESKDGNLYELPESKDVPLRAATCSEYYAFLGTEVDDVFESDGAKYDISRLQVFWVSDVHLNQFSKYKVVFGSKTLM